MTDRDALLRAVCAAPDDDLPRLVFADWLQDHGEPDLAEFIRVQCELARTPDEPRAAGTALRARESALFHRNRDDWVAPLRPFIAGVCHEPFEFRRGFVEAMELADDVLVEDGDAIFALAPLREAWLPDVEEFGGLAGCEHLARLHTLDLTGSGLSRYFDPAPLLRSPVLRNLTTLVAGGLDDNGHLDIVGVRALTASEHLRKLRVLDLSGNWLLADDPGTLDVLAAAANLPAVQELSFRRCLLGDAGVATLARTPWLAQLHRLNLSRNGIGPAGAIALAESPFLGGLERLDIGENDITGRHNAAADPVVRRLLERFGDRVTLR